MHAASRTLPEIEKKTIFIKSTHCGFSLLSVFITAHIWEGVGLIFGYLLQLFLLLIYH